MTPIILIALIIFGPAVILYFLKVNAVYVYLSLCMGEVLSFFIGTNAKTNNLILNNELLHAHIKSTNDVRLVLLVLPALLITIMMIRTASHSKFSLNIISCLAVGLLAVYLVIPLLNFDTSVGLASSKVWQKLVLYQPEVIGASAIFILLMLFMERSKLGSHKSKKHN